MKAIEFCGVNLHLAENQDEYNTLPVMAGDGPDGPMLFCFEPSEQELSTMIETRKLWVSQLTFSECFHPIWLGVERPQGWPEVAKANTEADRTEVEI